jgi:hypothetical protein
MKDELQYEEIDDDGNPLERSRTIRKEMLPANSKEQELLWKAFNACGNRKHFGDMREYKDWRKITNDIRNGKMSREWIESCIEWAQSMNKNTIAIRFFALESAILNAVRQQEWEAKNKMLMGAMDTVIIEESPDVIDIEE